jgi:protoporphyrinogen IX oxidase
MDTTTLYYTVKTLHIISFVAWMAGMFYLPRLYVYHASAVKGGEADAMLQTMERKLLRFIMNPAMIATWVFGLWLAVITQAFTAGGWFHAKMFAVMLMSGVHGLLAVHRGGFARGDNAKSERYYRWLNEAPTVLLIVIVWLVVFKPF